MSSFSRKTLSFFHKLFGNRGLWDLPFVPKLYELFYKFLSSDKLITVSYGDLKITLYERDSGCGRLLSLPSLFEEYELDLFKNSIEEGNMVFDLGANIGLYSLAACRKLNSTGCVYAFEPSPFNFDLLKKNLEQNGFNSCVLEMLLVTDTDSNQKLYLDKYQHGNHSTVRSNVPNIMDSIDIGSTTLDKYCSKNDIPVIDVLKIDVQGAEPSVLKGAANLLTNKSIKKIFIEYWVEGLEEESDLIGLIESYGYKVYIIDEANKSLVKFSDHSAINTGCHNLYCEL